MNKNFWSDAAKAGGLIGLLMVIVALLDALLGLNGARGVISFLNFVILAFFIYWFGKKRSVSYGSDGFSYGQSMGYILAMMLFTGFILGFGNYLLQNFISPEYYNEMYETALQNNPFADPDSELGRKTMELSRMMIKNPIFQLFSGILGTVVYGGFIGLIASAFIKRKPDIFIDNTTGIQE